MEQETRNKLQRATQQIRRILEAEFAEQLEGTFDILASGRILPEAGKHLNARQVLTRQKLVDAIEHIKAGGKKPQEAVDDYTREAAFTFLNRFVALRMLEARGMLQECVSKGDQSSGFKEFCGLAPGLSGLDDGGYRLYLECLFDELSVEVKVLFDRRDSASLLWPRRGALTELLNILSDSDLAAVWSQDETIGWVYQYFNSGEERKKMRDESQAPRNSRELAVRNQFFTPRYVVEFLTDNTLGRIWYEMRQGQTVLVDKCRYLVRRPSEVFLSEGQAPPLSDREADQNLSQEELLRQTVYIPYRVKKDPRDLKILDPACGSGHFLLYAFDLLITIYEEAWHDDPVPNSEITGKSLREDYPELRQLHAAMPGLVLGHNLHGIDIDPRAAQIAALALWMRGQQAFNQFSIPRAQRPSIFRSNIICAEPMPGEKSLLREFVDQQFAEEERPAFAFLLERVFDRMALAGEAGSLLRIEEEIRTTIAEAHALAIRQSGKRQKEMFADNTRRGTREPEFDLRGLNEEQFWKVAEQRIYDALEAYAKQAEHGGGFQRRLFSDDAAQGFAFIDLCRKRYDVVVMNPPFGEAAGDTFDYIAELFPNWNRNILCAFFARASELLASAGAVGAIYDRTILVKSTYEGFRREILLGKTSISCLADLGWEVLDANVEVAALVLREKPDVDRPFFDVRRTPNNLKGDELSEKVGGVSATDVWYASPANFLKLPNSVIGYDFKPYMLRAFSSAESILQSGFQAFTGSQLPKEPHFRLWWEPSLAVPKSFVRNIFKGGSFAPYVCSLRDVFVADVPFSELPTGSSTKIYNLEYYGKPGVAWGERGDWLCAYILPKDCCFALEGPTVPVAAEDERLALLGFLNTPVAREMVNRICGQHKTSGYVNLLPYPAFNEVAAIASEVRSAVSVLLLPRRFDETQLWFIGFGDTSSLNALTTLVHSEIGFAIHVSQRVQNHLHEACAAQFDLTEDELADLELLVESLPNESLPVEDADYDDGCGWFVAHSIFSYALGCVFGRWDIRYATGERPAPELPDPFAPLPVCPPGMLQGDDGLPLSPEAGRRLRTEGHYPLDVAWDGILVDDPEHPLDLELRVHAALAVIWNDRVDAVQQEACELLDVPNLREWFRRPAGFFADHLKRYSKSRRKAPVYWPLSTPSACYTVWLYYHRFAKDTFFKVAEIVKEKATHQQQKFARLKAEFGDSPTRTQSKELETQEKISGEIRTLLEEVNRIAPLWNPNLNDGVIINFAPLWRLVPHNKAWQKECKACWDELVAGEYDWAHLAMHLWPERVVPKCVDDASLAIAHGLETVFWDQDERDRFQPKQKPSGGWQPVIDELVKARTSPAVKAALTSLLEAPVASSGTKRTGGRRGAAT